MCIRDRYMGEFQLNKQKESNQAHKAYVESHKELFQPVDFEAIKEHSKKVEEMVRERTHELMEKRVNSVNESALEQKIKLLPKSSYYYRVNVLKSKINEIEERKMEEVRERIKKTMEYAKEAQKICIEELRKSHESSVANIKQEKIMNRENRSSERTKGILSSLEAESEARHNKAVGTDFEESIGISPHLEYRNIKTLKPSRPGHSRTMSRDYIQEMRSQVNDYGSVQRVTEDYVKTILHDSDKSLHQKQMLIRSKLSELDRRYQSKEKLLYHTTSRDPTSIVRVSDEIDQGYITSIKAKLSLLQKGFE
eukprot:TRINITY_DN5573_c0_g1_i4.p1 TRINITY_DN5573_c0_g1~~TRINITY_DN5573_c0_g1_i4.p1  ORF type:complete len:329 (+),score=62.00 TRINITY_DN5573_c0_g1_i4:61-987(+)